MGGVSPLFVSTPQTRRKQPQWGPPVLGGVRVRADVAGDGHCLTAMGSARIGRSQGAYARAAVANTVTPQWGPPVLGGVSRITTRLRTFTTKVPQWGPPVLGGVSPTARLTWQQVRDRNGVRPYWAESVGDRDCGDVADVDTAMGSARIGRSQRAAVPQDPRRCRATAMGSARIGRSQWLRTALTGTRVVTTAMGSARIGRSQICDQKWSLSSVCPPQWGPPVLGGVREVAGDVLHTGRGTAMGSARIGRSQHDAPCLDCGVPEYRPQWGPPVLGGVSCLPASPYSAVSNSPQWGPPVLGGVRAVSDGTIDGNEW